jgi:hypothetical protein
MSRGDGQQGPADTTLLASYRVFLVYPSLLLSLFRFVHFCSSLYAAAYSGFTHKVYILGAFDACVYRGLILIFVNYEQSHEETGMCFGLHSPKAKTGSFTPTNSALT